jgi:hypothetical protein
MECLETMRAKLIFSLLFILAMLVGCASNGDQAAPITQDPLMAIYQNAASDQVKPNETGSKSTSEEQQTQAKPQTNEPSDQTTRDNQSASQEQQDPLMAVYHSAASDQVKPNETDSASTAEEQQTQPKPETNEPSDQTAQDNQTASQKLTEADDEVDDATPVPESEPRHQSLLPVTLLPNQPEPKSQEPEVIVQQEPTQGDPLLNAYHRQIKAAPLSDDVEPSSNLITAAPSASGKEPLTAEQEGEPQKETEPKAAPDSQQEISASLHQQTSAISPASEKPTEEKAKSEPVLANPPEQVQQKQVWIEQVDLIKAKGQIIVEIQLSGKASPDIYMSDEQGDSPTLVLDFPGVIGKSFPYRISAPPAIATAIHMANYREKARVVVDLIPQKSYEVQPAWLKGKNKLLVSIGLQ